MTIKQNYSLRPALRRSCALLALALLTSSPLPASAEDSTLPGLKLTVVRHPLDANALINRACITAGYNKLSFLIPEGFHVNGSEGRSKLKFINQEGSTEFVFGLVSMATNSAGGLDLDACRELIQEENPGAKILEGVQGKTGGWIGPAFDADVTTPSGSIRRVRTLYAPCPFGGVFEIRFTTGLDHKNDLNAMARTLVSSLWISPDGKAFAPEITNLHPNG